ATGVIVALGTNPSEGTLSGTTTVTASGGLATFATLSVDRPGAGYTLAATASGLVAATSAAFHVGLTFAAVSTGFTHTCGVTTPGAAYCWGDNSSGQLGDGTTATRLSPVLVQGGLHFAAVTGGLDLLAVSAGGPHSCGLTTAHVAYCWGDNSFGELGDGTMTNSPTPVAAGRPTPGAGTWASKASMPTARNDVTGAGVGATFYAVGGKTGNTCAGLKILEAYDPVTDTWA